MSPVATPSFASRLMRGLDAFDCHAQPLERVGEVRRRAGPRAQIARIAEHAANGDAIEAQRAKRRVWKGRVHVRPSNIARHRCRQ